MNLKGVSAIITGASQGLGAAMAEAFVAEGASVVLCARTTSAVDKICDDLSRNLIAGQQVHARTCDIGTPEQIDALLTDALEIHPDLGVLVNNAGVYGPMGNIETVDWNEWVQAINVNLLGTIYFCRAVMPHFRKRGRGKIINLSGGGATAPLPGISSYAVSKVGVVRFTETLHEEAKNAGIDVNAIAPGLLATQLLDQAIAAGPAKIGGKFYQQMIEARSKGGTPLNIAAALGVWLASSASDGISGKLLSAVWDPWRDLPKHLSELEGSDIYTLRRIVPKDRGKGWGDI